MAILKSIHIQGFKSIRDTRVELGRVNVLIGANASGKSNLVAFFRLLVSVGNGRLQAFIGHVGGASVLLHFGPKKTKRIQVELGIESSDSSGWNARFSLSHTADDRLIYVGEGVHPLNDPVWSATETVTWMGTLESVVFQPRLHEGLTKTNLSVPYAEEVALHLRAGRAFQFHDTSPESAIRRGCPVDDNLELNREGSNLAAVLHKFVKVKPAYYRRIVATIRQVFPQLDDFILEPDALAPTQIRLNWRVRGQDNLFGPHQFSDGTLRFIALATLLLQPEEELPKVIVIDEPELGLHPYAIGVLASLVKAASRHCQVIIATQSVTLLDQFEPSDVIVVERDPVHNATEFRRLNADELAVWKDEYERPIALGELWERNIIGGGPH